MRHIVSNYIVVMFLLLYFVTINNLYGLWSSMDAMHSSRNYANHTVLPEDLSYILKIETLQSLPTLP